MKKQLIAMALAMACAAPSLANASKLEQVDMTFDSGATFAGIVTFANNFSEATSVNGVLSGSVYGSESIGWVLDRQNYSTGVANYSTFLMTGTPQGGSTDFLEFAVNYANPAQLVFTTGRAQYGTDNYVDYFDSMTSGTITEILQPPVSVVPEISTSRMLGSGLVVLLVAAFRRRRRH